MILIEVIGLIGFVMLIISLAQRDREILHWLNLSGSILLAVYSFYHQAVFVAWANIVIIFINIYRLITHGKTKK